MIGVGISSIIIGAVFFLGAIMTSVNSAPQQTVQYLGFVCGAVFIVGGFLIVFLNSLNNSIKALAQKPWQQSSNASVSRSVVSPTSSEETKKCLRCLKRVAIDYTSCPHCGGNSFD